VHYDAWRICVVDIGWELQQWLFNEMCFWNILMINWHLHNDIHLTFALIISHSPLKLKAILLTKQSVYNCVDFLFFLKDANDQGLWLFRFQNFWYCAACNFKILTPLTLNPSEIWQFRNILLTTKSIKSTRVCIYYIWTFRPSQTITIKWFKMWLSKSVKLNLGF